MIDLTIPAGLQRREWVIPPLHDIFDRVLDRVADQTAPPALESAADRVARACAHDDPVAADDALGELAHAAIAARVRVRCAYPDLAGAV